MAHLMMNYCTSCGSLMRSPEHCQRCGQAVAQPHMASMEEIVSAARHSCQACYKSMLSFAQVCPACLVIQDPSRPPPRSLPPAVQRLMDKREFEPYYLYIVLPEGSPEPDPEAVTHALQQAELYIGKIEPASLLRGHRPRWEQSFEAHDPDRVVRSRTVSEPPDRVHVWLEETGVPADMGLLNTDLLPELRRYIHTSQWTIGLYCAAINDPSWSTRLMMRLVRCIYPGLEPLVVEKTTGRMLPDVWREAAELKPVPLVDCYVIDELERDGMLWLRSRGLSRWGCFELELLGVPEAQRSEGQHMIRAVAELLLEMRPYPPPWHILTFSNGAAFAWVPLEHVQEHFSPELVGMGRSDRRRLKQVTVLLVSPYFHPELFTHIQQQPPPPRERVQPGTDTLSNQFLEETSEVQPEASDPVPTAPTRTPAPMVAAALSLFVPGGGQYLLGQKTKGLVMLGVALCTCGLLGLLNLLAAVDALLLAEHRQLRELGEWEFFWSGKG